MNATFEIPPFLKDEPGDKGFASLQLLDIRRLIEDFASQFRIDQDIAAAAVLAGASHSLGGAVGINTTFGIIRAPFSLLLVTPEPEPVWPEVPVRFLTHNFEQTVRMFADALPARKQLAEDDPETADLAPETDKFERLAQVGQRLYADNIADRVAQNCLVAPFPRTPFDHHVLLTTPPAGLRRGFRQLTIPQKIRLENALSSSRPPSSLPGEPLGALPSFYWVISRDECARFLEENPWFAGVPFLMLQSKNPGNPSLDTDTDCVRYIFHRCLDLFVRRHQAMGKGKVNTVDPTAIRPVRSFLGAAQKWQAHAAEGTHIPVRRIAAQALKFAMVIAAFAGKPGPDLVSIECGLALAKRLTRRHYQTLSALLPVESKNLPDTCELSDMERRVFIRICERSGISRSELSRSFNKLRKDERDEILVNLLARNLIKIENGGLHQVLA